MTMTQTRIIKNDFSINDLALFGDGVLAYVKAISVEDAKDLIGTSEDIPDNIKLYCLFSANGTPLAISDSQTSAVANAFEHDLEPIHLQ